MVAGCDDGKVYAWDASGKQLRGWPVTTGRDVFSTPAIADVDGDGHPEVVVGSDDGRLYVLRPDGTSVEGFPVATDGFISSSPAVGDIDGDGKAEIVVGSWDKRVHAWRSDGSPVPGWPVQTGHFVWSPPLLVDIFGDGRLEIIVASDRLYVFYPSGRLIGLGFTGGGYCVASPAIGGRSDDPVVISAASSVTASRIGGGWTTSLRSMGGGSRRTRSSVSGNYIWSSPVLGDVDGDGENEIAVASWDGSIHIFRHTGAEMQEVGMVTSGPLFSTPAIGDIDGDGHLEIAVGSWDGYIYLWRTEMAGVGTEWPMFRGGPARTGAVQRRFTNGGMLSFTEPLAHSTPPEVKEVATVPKVPAHRLPTLVTIEGRNLTAAAGATMWYKITGEERVHPVPMVCSGGALVGIIQPLGALRVVSFHIEFDEPGGRRVRIPSNKEYSFKVALPILSRMLRPVRLDVSATGQSGQAEPQQRGNRF